MTGQRLTRIVVGLIVFPLGIYWLLDGVEPRVVRVLLSLTGSLLVIGVLGLVTGAASWPSWAWARSGKPCCCRLP